jgi:hypothetical protein
LSLSQVLGRYPAALYDQKSEQAAPHNLCRRQTCLQYFHSIPAQV